MVRSNTAPGAPPKKRSESPGTGDMLEWLDAPILRVTAADVPLPYSPPLEDYVLPQTPDIVTALRRLAAY